MALKDIVITASINSYPTLSYGQKTFIASTDEQSFPVERAIGGQAGVWPEFNGTDYTTNLFVNISQSWSGSNITPLGIVPFIHNNNEEFFNGEFSGSILDVTDGNLTDPDCIPVLQVNTTPIDYNVFIFYKNTIGLNQFPSLLNIFTAPNPGEVYLGLFNFSGTQAYAMYAKIAKVDALGNDNTLSLQELKQFRYIDTTAGEIICNVVNITEYPTYYLYEVTSNTITALPTNINVIDYDLSVTSAPSQFLGLNIDYLISNWVVGTDAAGGFSSGNYIFSGTPTSTIAFTVSGQFTPPAFGPGSQTIDFGIADVTDTLAQGTPAILISYTTVTISSTNQFVTHNASITNFTSGRTYRIFVRQGRGATAGMEVNTLTWTFNSAPAQSNTNFFILEPYLLSNFRNSDCDVLMNNYSENDYSRFYREVLYNNGGVIPSNIQQIISGTAQFAEINDYLYHASANRLPRYDGVRTTSANLNQFSKNGLSNKELSNIPDSSQLIINNGVPNVENLQTYFASFDYFQDTTGELLNKSAAHITYLIDKDGTVFTPSLSSSYYWNLIDNFETYKNANVIIYNENGDKVTLGNKRILRPGALPRAILESQIGYNSKVINNISFGTSTNNTSGEAYDFSYSARFGVNNASVQKIALNSTNAAVVPADGVLQLELAVFDNSNVTLTNNAIKFLKGSSNYLVNIQATIIATLYGGSSGTFTMSGSFQYSDDGEEWISFYDTAIIFGPNAANACIGYASTPSFSPIENRSYRLVLSHDIPSFVIWIWSDRPDFPGEYTRLDVIQQSGGSSNTVLNYISNYNTTTGVYAPYSPGAIGTYTILPISSTYTLTSPNADINVANNAIEILTTSNRTKLNFTVNTLTRIKRNINLPSGVVNRLYVNLILKRSTDGGLTWTNYNTYLNYYCGTNNNAYANGVLQSYVVNNSYTFNVDVDAIAGHMYQLVIANYNTYFDAYFDSNSFIEISQTSVPAPPVVLPAASASIYWETGSSSQNILSSSYFYPYYSTTGLYTQNSISDIYGPNLPFTLSPYTDVIRFEGDEDQIYFIIDVYTGVNNNVPPTSSLFLKLDKNIIPGTNTNSFLIRRYHPNPNFITMDMPIISGSGFLLPEYTTNEIKQNFDNIIVNLRERGLI